MKKTKAVFIAILTLFLAFVIQDFNTVHKVNAAPKTIQTIRYVKTKNEALAYNKNGDYLTNNKDLIKTNAVLKYYGTPTRIKGQKYICFNIGKGRYIPLNSIGKLDSKSTFRLLRNSYIYNKYGNKLGKLSFRYPVHFVGNLKKTTQNKKYFVFKKNYLIEESANPQKYYLPYKKIGKSYYYLLGNGRYINVRNVAAINGYPNCSNGERITTDAPDKKFPVYTVNDTEDPIMNSGIPNHKIITVDAKTTGPQYFFRIKGTHYFVDSSDVKYKDAKAAANLLPYYWDLK